MDQITHTDKDGLTVRCLSENCTCELGVFPSKEAAAEAWNRRGGKQHYPLSVEEFALRRECIDLAFKVEGDQQSHRFVRELENNPKGMMPILIRWKAYLETLPIAPTGFRPTDPQEWESLWRDDVAQKPQAAIEP